MSTNKSLATQTNQQDEEGLIELVEVEQPWSTVCVKPKKSASNKSTRAKWYILKEPEQDDDDLVLDTYKNLTITFPHNIYCKRIEITSPLMPLENEFCNISELVILADAITGDSKNRCEVKFTFENVVNLDLLSGFKIIQHKKLKHTNNFMSIGTAKSNEVQKIMLHSCSVNVIVHAKCMGDHCMNYDLELTAYNHHTLMYGYGYNDHADVVGITNVILKKFQDGDSFTNTVKTHICVQRMLCAIQRQRPEDLKQWIQHQQQLAQKQK